MLRPNEGRDGKDTVVVEAVCCLFSAACCLPASCLLSDRWPVIGELVEESGERGKMLDAIKDFTGDRHISTTSEGIGMLSFVCCLLSAIYCLLFVPVSS
jgi:hypothetical protein